VLGLPRPAFVDHPQAVRGQVTGPDGGSRSPGAPQRERGQARSQAMPSLSRSRPLRYLMIFLYRLVDLVKLVTGVPLV